MGTQLTKLEQQREAHYAFASVRCRVYIGREEYFTEINVNRQKHIHQPYVLLGESGEIKGWRRTRSVLQSLFPMQSIFFRKIQRVSVCNSRGL